MCGDTMELLNAFFTFLDAPIYVLLLTGLATGYMAGCIKEHLQ